MQAATDPTTACCGTQCFTDRELADQLYRMTALCLSRLNVSTCKLVTQHMASTAAAAGRFAWQSCRQLVPLNIMAALIRRNSFITLV